jgi:hypothetical protein
MRLWSRMVGIARGLDWPSAAMAVVAMLAVGWTLWLRFGPPARGEPPAAGSVPPRLRLLDVDRAEPVVLVGLRGKVIWLTFWSARSPTAAVELRALDAVWRRFQDRTPFTMFAAAIETGEPSLVRAAVDASKVTVPVYLASAEMRQAYGASNPPLHVIIGDDGRVIAVARGVDEGTMKRLTRQVEQRLDQLEPRHNGRFAWQ